MGPRPRRGRGAAPGRRGAAGFRPPSRITVIDRLDRDGLLPAITFVFSRAGCDAAVGQCVRAGLRLTTEDEVAEIRRTVERRTADLPQADLGVLGYWEWREALERGIAAHHAGLLPAFKETVEELFVRGLVRAVFATETLALGINMPARTVVLERLVKFNGEAHAELTPGEYTQLTGRAGPPRHRRRGPRRRGLAARGRPASRSPGWPPPAPTRCAARSGPATTWPSTSSAGWASTAARELLEQSFGQFQADRSVVGLARRIERNTEALAGLRGVDAVPPRRLRRVRRAAPPGRRAGEGAVAGRAWPQQRERGGRLAARAAARRRHRGAGRAAGRAGRRARPRASTDGDDPRPLVLTEDRWAGRLSTADFPAPVERAGPDAAAASASTTAPRAVRRDLASSLRNTGIVGPATPGGAAARAGARTTTRSSPRCAGRCARTPATAATTGRRTPGGPSGTPGWSARPSSCGRRSGPPRTRWPGRSTGSARCWASAATSTATTRSTVTARGAAGPAVGRVRPARRRVPAARRLGRPRARRAGRGGLRAGLRVAPGPRAGAAGAQSGRVSEALAATVRLWAELEADERRHRVDRTREPDLGFAWPMHRWARGRVAVGRAHRGRAERRRAVGGRLRPLVPPGARPARPGRGGRRARHAGRGAAAAAARSVRRGVVAAGTA